MIVAFLAFQILPLKLACTSHRARVKLECSAGIDRVLDLQFDEDRAYFADA